MSAWSTIAKAVSKLFKGGGAAASGAAAGQGTKVILTWGNTVKVAVVGCFSYLFLTGGLSNVVSTTLGIPEGIAQVIVVVVFVFLLALAVRYLVNYARDRMGLRREYIDTPILTGRSDRDCNRRQGREYAMYLQDGAPFDCPGRCGGPGSEGYDRRLYDGSDRGRRG